MRSFSINNHVKRGTAFLFALRTTNPDQRGRELALRTLMLGTLGLTSGAFLIVCVNFVTLHLNYLLPRIAIIGVAIALIIGLYALTVRGHVKFPAYSMLTFYFVAATAAVWLWGVETPIGVLLFALVVIFAGILLGARYSLYAVALVLTVQFSFVGLLHAGIASPDTSWAATPARAYDVVIFAIILGNIALVSWLFNRSIEHSLLRAQRSEKALLQQKKLLEVKVEERTRQVQLANLERIQELYRFAELGHVSVALLHDMANYLTVLSLDIEGLQKTHRNQPTSIQRVEQSVHHLNSLIKQVRKQIKGETQPISFNIADEISQVMRVLQYKADAAHVTLQWQPEPHSKALGYVGSVNHFWQIIMNLISNAIDAYSEHDAENRVVHISAQTTPGGIIINVTDFGKGIATNHYHQIFEPFYSTKKGGTGIGLAITKRMVEKDFGGSITVMSKVKHGTTFTVTLPAKSTANA